MSVIQQRRFTACSPFGEATVQPARRNDSAVSENRAPRRALPLSLSPNDRLVAARVVMGRGRQPARYRACSASPSNTKRNQQTAARAAPESCALQILRSQPEGTGDVSRVVELTRAGLTLLLSLSEPMATAGMNSGRHEIACGCMQVTFGENFIGETRPAVE